MVAGTLIKKALRDLKSHWGAYLACAMLMGIGIMFYASMNQSVQNIPIAMERFYKEKSFGDAFATVRSMPSSRLKRLEGINGVEKASGRLTFSSRMVNDENRTIELKLYSYDLGETDKLNDVLITEGRLPGESKYEILLSQSFYTVNSFKEGDTLTLAILGKRVDFTVVGCVQTPEYIYITPEGSMFPDDKNYGVAYIPLDIMENLFGRAGEINDISFAFSDGILYKNIEKALKDALYPYGIIKIMEREDQSSHDMITMELQSLDAMVSSVPVIFLMLGALIMSVVIKRMVEQQHAQIGLMKAYGYTSWEILAHYCVYGVAMGVLSTLIGGIFGAGVSGYMAGLYSAYFKMPGISGAFSAINVLKFFVLALIFGIGASLYGARSVLKLSAAMAMAPPSPISGKAILLERFKALWKRLSIILQLSMRNMFRARARTIMTITGLSVCYALTASVFAFSPMVDTMMVEEFERIQRYDVKITFAAPVDTKSVENSLLSMKGVDKAEGVLEIPIILRLGGQSRDSVLLAIDNNSAMYNIQNSRRDIIALPEKGIMLNDKVAKSLGVKRGDTITLDIPYINKEVKVYVAGSCEQYLSNYTIVNRDYFFNTARIKPMATSAMIIGQKGNEREMQALLERLNDSTNITGVFEMEQMKNSLEEMLKTSMSTLYIMAFLAVFAGFAIVYNASVVVLSERLRELVSMRVMGFTVKETVKVVAAEQLLALCTGIIAGMPLSGYTMIELAKAVSTDTMSIPTDIPMLSHIVSIVCMLLAWGAAMGVTARKINKTEMTDVLKGRE